MPYLVFF